MKIGILTFHDDINYGAFLQTYALRKYISDLGHNVQVINYKNIRHSILLKIVLFHKIYNPKYTFGNIKKVVLFNNAARYLNLTKIIFSPKKINKMKFDYVIYGSDEIWNFTNQLYKLDTTYFGDLVETKKISYAPSFGPISDYRIVPKKVKLLLKNFDYLSTRDLNSKKIAEKITKKKIVKVLDPTFLYDFSKEARKSKLKINSEYLLVYATGIPEKIKNEVVEFAKENKLEILSIGFYYDWADKNFISVGPFEYLKIFKKADFVVTNTFHGTIFSIKFKKQFITLVSKYRKNKITDLLAMLDLDKQAIEPGNTDYIGQLLSKKIIFNKKTDKNLDKNIKSSKNYLKKILKKE